MKLVDRSISEFTKVLSSDAPAPGGGSTAALGGALGAALLGMVASLTVGRVRYAESEPLMKSAIKRAEELRLKMLDIIDRDTDAYNAVTEVFSMPNDTDDEKASRSAALQDALKACTLTPFEMIECSLMALELADEMVGRCNVNAASDLGVAVLNLKASAQGAWLNVLINLDGIKDEIFSAKYTIQGSEHIKEISELADNIHNEILKELLPK